jgi:hypothetical protein
MDKPRQEYTVELLAVEKNNLSAMQIGAFACNNYEQFDC